MLRLTPISPGVVHSSPYRTRLKTAKWSGASENDVALVKDALERVPGVKEVRPMASGFVLEHESRPDVVENIGVALSEVSPVLLEHLTEDPHKHSRQIPVSGDRLFDRLKTEAANYNLPDLTNMSLDEAAPLVKKAIPAILAGAGALLLLEGESILAGVGPLALFYWAFDYNWKMRQEKAIDKVSEDVNHAVEEASQP
jgi:hypothetical protein